MSNEFANICFATAMSRSLDVMLHREFLLPSFFKGGIDLQSRNMQFQGVTDFFEVERIGVERNTLLSFEHFVRMFNLPETMALKYILAHDGHQSKIFYGTHIHSSSTPSPKAMSSNQLVAGINLLQSIFPGTKIQRLKHLPNNNFEKSLPFCSVITGIPGICKSQSDQKTLAFVDMFSRGMQGRPYMLFIQADPIPLQNISSILFACREMAGQIESLSKWSVTQGENKSSNFNFSVGHSKSVSQKDIEKSIEYGVMGGLCFAPLALLNPMLPLAGIGIGASFAPSITTAESSNISYGEQVGYSSSIAVNYVNKHAEAMAKVLNKWSARFEKGENTGLWNTSAFILTTTEEDQAVANVLLASLLNGEMSLEPVRVHCLPYGDKACYSSLNHYIAPTVQITPLNGSIEWHHPFGNMFCNLSTVCTSEELAATIMPPSRSIPGIDVVDYVEDTSQTVKPILPNSIVLGETMHLLQSTNIDYPIDINKLSKHALVAGINGSGKTTTIKRILAGMGHSPYMVIEPAKTEYVDWALEHNRQILKQHNNDAIRAQKDQGWINVYMPGRSSFSGEKLSQLALNPFDFVWLGEQEEPHISEHVDNLITIVNAILPMQEILPILMEELIYKVYTAKGIDRHTFKHTSWLYGDDSLLKDPMDNRPTFKQLKLYIDEVIGAKGYDRQVTGNLRAAMSTRIASFTRGWRGELLNSEKADPHKWAELFDRPTVINLTAIASDDDKAFFMAILFLFLYEYRRASDEIKRDSHFKHLLVLEEAHRILQNPRVTPSGSADAKGKIAEMFSYIISEIRAYGQGLLIADQVPCRLNDDAIKNTNLKIVHRLVSEDDRHTMAVALNLRPAQERMIGNLETGQVLIREDGDNEAYHVKISNN